MFGGRAMALGNLKMARLSSPSTEAFEAVATDVEDLFRSRDPADAARIMRARSIDFVLVGAREKAAYGAGASKFDTHPDLFERVYAALGISIYRLR